MANNSNTGAVFERHEKKYILTAAQFHQLTQYLPAFAYPDEYGQHTICSLYYDTDDFDVIRHSLDKPVFKEKLRLRSYGIPTQDGTVFLELKKKFSGVTYKHRIPLVLREAVQYLNQGIKPREQGQIFGEIDWYVEHHMVFPKILLCYDRIALCGTEDPHLRITFDKNVRWRDSDLNLSRGDYGTPLLEKGQYLMEIKTLQSLPLELSGILSELEIYPSSFSKYGAAYQEKLAGKTAGKEYRHAG